MVCLSVLCCLYVLMCLHACRTVHLTSGDHGKNENKTDTPLGTYVGCHFRGLGRGGGAYTENTRQKKLKRIVYIQVGFIFNSSTNSVPLLFSNAFMTS